MLLSHRKLPPRSGGESLPKKTSLPTVKLKVVGKMKKKKDGIETLALYSYMVLSISSYK
jgi:hypothetical protein